MVLTEIPEDLPYPIILFSGVVRPQPKDPTFQRARLRTIETALGLSGLFLSFAGMGAIFWHFTWGAAVLFLLVSTPVLVYVAFILLIYDLQQEKRSLQD
jgi:hypothetical protein